MKTEEVAGVVAAAHEGVHGHADGNRHDNGNGNGEVDGHVAEARVGYDPSHSGEQRVPREGQGEGMSGLKGILEAILFVSGEPLSVDRMLGVVEGVAREDLLSALRALQA